MFGRSSFVRQVARLGFRFRSRNASNATNAKVMSRLQNVYHDENPMRDVWRKRDLLACLRETHETSQILDLCNQYVDLTDSETKLQPREAALLISKFGKAEDAAAAEKIHDQGVVEGSTSSEILYVKTALIHAFIRNGKLDDARTLFLELQGDVSYTLDAALVGAGAKIAAQLQDKELLERVTGVLEADENIVAPTEYHTSRMQYEGGIRGPEAAEKILEDIIAKKEAVGHVLAPQEARPLYETLCQVYSSSKNYDGMLTAAVRMVDACQRPTESVVLQAIAAVNELSLEDEDVRGRLYKVFIRFRAGPRIKAHVYEALMEALFKQDDWAGTATVYDEASSKSRPTERMTEMVQQSLRQLPRTYSVERAHSFGLTT